MESKDIKEIRRKKYLEKMKNKNNIYQKENNDAPLINDTTPIPENNYYIQENCSKSNGETITELSYNSNKNINNSYSNNIDNNSETKIDKIDYNGILKKINKYELIELIINIMKKMIIIILTIFHCLNIYSSDNIQRFEYSFIILEISSLVINILFKNKKKNQYKSYVKILDDKSINKNELFFNQIMLYLKISFVHLTFLEYIFQLFSIFMDVLVDIAIIFIVNFCLFIINEEDD